MLLSNWQSQSYLWNLFCSLRSKLETCFEPQRALAGLNFIQNCQNVKNTKLLTENGNMRLVHAYHGTLLSHIRSDVLTYVTPRMNLESLMLGDVRQKQMACYRMTPLTRDSRWKIANRKEAVLGLEDVETVCLGCKGASGGRCWWWLTALCVREPSAAKLCT